MALVLAVNQQAVPLRAQPLRAQRSEAGQAVVEAPLLQPRQSQQMLAANTTQAADKACNQECTCHMGW